MSPQRDLRNDDDGNLDDVVVTEVEMFRLERMDSDRWWMRLYMADGEDLVFHVELVKGVIQVFVEIEQRDDTNNIKRRPR